MESSQERPTASTEDVHEDSSHTKMSRLELTTMMFLATPFMQRLMPSIEPVSMLLMVLLFT